MEAKRKSEKPKGKMARFERERRQVQALADLLGLGASQVHNPGNERDESGVDVILAMDSGLIGIQVTEFDAGAGHPSIGRGRLRRDEKKRVKSAEEEGHPNAYGGMVPATPELAFAEQVNGKVQIAQGCDLSKWQEVWLLVVANLNEWGSLNATFAGFGNGKLNAAILDECCGGVLAQSNFDRAYLHLIVGKTLYEWLPRRGWKLLDEEKPPGPDDRGVRKWRESLRGRGGRK